MEDIFYVKLFGKTSEVGVDNSSEVCFVIFFKMRNQKG